MFGFAVSPRVLPHPGKVNIHFQEEKDGLLLAISKQNHTQKRKKNWLRSLLLHYELSDTTLQDKMSTVLLRGANE